VLRGGARSHIAIESLEVVDPLWVDGNAASTPMKVVGTVWVETTIFHRNPSLVFHSMNQTVFPIRDNSSSRHSPNFESPTPIGTTVVVLLNSSSPPYISHHISPFIIDAVKGMLRGITRAYMLQEGRKIVNPQRVDHDAPTPIVGVSRVVRVEASCLDLLPAFVLWGLTQSM
jgi:hypothetical protein